MKLIVRSDHFTRRLTIQFLSIFNLVSPELIEIISSMVNNAKLKLSVYHDVLIAKRQFYARYNILTLTSTILDI